jgi:hypothetical protein
MDMDNDDTANLMMFICNDCEDSAASGDDG